MVYMQQSDVAYLKAHNGIATDMEKLVAAAKADGIEDPIGDLAAAGILGIIDPARFIPQHGIKELQHAKEGVGGSTHSGYLKNEDLYRMATGKSMEENGLCPHRALDDAKAEREWLSLPAVITALYGSAPRLPCAVSLASYRTYSEQYEKHRAFLARSP